MTNQKREYSTDNNTLAHDTSADAGAKTGTLTELIITDFSSGEDNDTVKLLNRSKYLVTCCL